MTVGKRIWFSFVIGWSIKLIPLLIATFIQNSLTFNLLFVTNFDLYLTILWLNNGHISGNESQTTLGHIIIASIGYFSGLITYPIIIFLFLKILQKFKRNKF